MWYNWVAEKQLHSKVIYAMPSIPYNFIYRRNRKRQERSKYLLSIDGTVKEENFPAMIICIGNNSKRELAGNPQYGYWLITKGNHPYFEKLRNIEIFFKPYKSYLGLVKECRNTSYNVLNAHTTTIFTQYMMLSVVPRRHMNDKAPCKLLFCIMNKLDYISFTQYIRIIIDSWWIL